MELWTIIGAALITTALAVMLRSMRQEYAMMVSLGCGILLFLWAVTALKPALEELRSLMKMTRLDEGHGEILIKALGISFLTQMAADTCKDAGESAIAAKVELCGRICILVLSLPMFVEVLKLASSLFAL